MTTRLVMGAMTGTSLDGLDVALVRAEGTGLDLRIEFEGHLAVPFGGLAERLRAAAEQQPATAATWACLARDLGRFHADVMGDFCGDIRPALACVHGQTVAHDATATWQLLDPTPIARRLGCPVVHDLRRADMAAGGRGAPLTPIADWIIYRDCAEAQAVVNLGGFVNMTILPARATPHAIDHITGEDVCAGNQVLDAVARAVLDAPFDAGGSAALQGAADPGARDDLAAQLAAQHGSRRALGTGDELAGWVSSWKHRLSPVDLAATAVEAIADVTARALADTPGLARVVLAGGGVRNAALARAIEHRLTTTAATPVMIDIAVPAVAREAVGMAVLGALTCDGVAISLPRITGCARPAPRGGLICPAP